MAYAFRPVYLRPRWAAGLMADVTLCESSTAERQSMKTYPARQMG